MLHAAPVLNLRENAFKERQDMIAFLKEKKKKKKKKSGSWLRLDIDPSNVDLFSRIFIEMSGI